MSERKVCCYCGAEGHRSNQCPRRPDPLPWTGGDLFLSTVLVAIIAGWFHA